MKYLMFLTLLAGMLSVACSGDKVATGSSKQNPSAVSEEKPASAKSVQSFNYLALGDLAAYEGKKALDESNKNRKADKPEEAKRFAQVSRVQLALARLYFAAHEALALQTKNNPKILEKKGLLPGIPPEIWDARIAPLIESAQQSTQKAAELYENEFKPLLEGGGDLDAPMKKLTASAGETVKEWVKIEEEIEKRLQDVAPLPAKREDYDLTEGETGSIESRMLEVEILLGGIRKFEGF